MQYPLGHCIGAMEGPSQEGGGLVCVYKGPPDCHLRRARGKPDGREGDLLVRRLWPS